MTNGTTLDPVQGLVDYVLEIKPYHTKVVEVLVEYIQTDIWARFQRLIGNDCLYICGDDAHGTPIMLSAQSQGITPEDLIKAMKKSHEQDFADFNIASIK